MPIESRSLYTNRLARIIIGYVKSFTDTWAFLVNESLADDDILAPTHAFIRWEKAVRVNNPLLTLSATVNRDGTNRATIDFELNVDETSGEHHLAILLMAIDSFLSLLAACSTVHSESRTEVDREGNKVECFSLYVPTGVPAEYLLSNKLGHNGFPVGDSGPFRKWCMVNAVKIFANERNVNVVNRLETVDRDTVSAAIQATRKTTKYFDDSEMSRCLALNKKNGKGEMYTISSDRKANNIRSLEKGGAVAEAAIAQKKKSRRKRDMSANPAVFVEKFVSPKKRKLLINGGASKKQSNIKFTSILMSPKEFTTTLDSSSSLRGAQRTKSLINKYISLLKANLSKNDSENVLSRWLSPEGRNIVVVGGNCNDHGTETIGFSVTCRKSELFKSFSSLHTLFRQWMKVSSEIHSIITNVGEKVPKTETVTEVLKSNLVKTSRTMIRGMKPLTNFPVPPCFASNSASLSSVSSIMGISNERYTKIVEVFDFLMSRGVFVNATLNFTFFDSCLDECPPNIDVMIIASECMGYITKLNNSKEHLDATLLKNENPRQFLERKMTCPVDTFVNMSQEFRSRKALPRVLTDICRENIAGTLKTRGAIAAFSDTTIEIKFNCSEVVMPLENTWWTDSRIRELGSIYEKNASAAQRFTSTNQSASTTTSAIVVASVLTVPSLTKITSSKRYPDNELFQEN